MRNIPEPLYTQVYELGIAVANASESGDDELAEKALGELRHLYELQRAAGSVDPFLTKVLADFTDDNAESIVLYRLAIEQSKSFPGEPLYSK